MSKLRCSGTMTESQYLSWIRSALRAKSLRWKPRNDCLVNARRKYVGENKLQKWEYLCANCGEYNLAKHCQVDHYPLDAGSILSIDDIGRFCNNLFCEVDNLRCLCKDCHGVYTLSSKLGITMEEAKIQKDIIKLLQDEKVSDIIMFIEMWNFDGVYLTNNAKNRRQSLSEIFNNVQ